MPGVGLGCGQGACFYGWGQQKLWLFVGGLEACSELLAGAAKEMAVGRGELEVLHLIGILCLSQFFHVL